MAVFLSPVHNSTHLKSDGTLAVNYRIYTYAEGSTTPLTTYTTSLGNVAQANYITLNARGECDNPIWLTGGLGYKFVYTDNIGAIIASGGYDNVRGVGDSTSTTDQYISFGGTATYISASSFSLIGDQTTLFEKGRALKLLTSGGLVYAKILSSAFTTLTTIVIESATGNLDTGLTGTNPSYGLLSNTNNALPSIIDTKIQNQTAIAFTTGGTSSAFTLTPTPAVSANTANQLFFVKFNAAPTGSPTLSISGQTALNLKYYDSTGTKQFVTSSVVPINWQGRVLNDGTDWVLLDILPPVASNKIQPITASVAASALTITVNPTTLDFRSATLTSGAVATLSLGASASVIVPSTATLGTVNAVQSRLVVLLINNAGTLEPAVVNIAGGNDLTETGIISTTAISAAATANNVIYSITARTNLAYRVVGYVESTQATAGTWATAPSTIQGVGGQALAALSSLGYGQTWQTVTRTSGTTYYNTTGKPIFIAVNPGGASSSGSITVAGFSVGNWSNNGGSQIFVQYAVIPPGINYVVTITAGTSSALELR